MVDFEQFVPPERKYPPKNPIVISNTNKSLIINPKSFKKMDVEMNPINEIGLAIATNELPKEVTIEPTVFTANGGKS